MRSTNPTLVWTGAALLVAGTLVLLATLLGSDSPSVVPLVGEAQARVEQPWQMWVVLAGLLLAAGGACLGIGMNRWRAH